MSLHLVETTGDKILQEWKLQLKGFFGVSAKDLTIPQAAFIAGLPQSPIVYSPYASDGSLKTPENQALGLIVPRMSCTICIGRVLSARKSTTNIVNMI